MSLLLGANHLCDSVYIDTNQLQYILSLNQLLRWGATVPIQKEDLAFFLALKLWRKVHPEGNPLFKSSMDQNEEEVSNETI